jgi:hypothetical protein
MNSLPITFVVPVNDEGVFNANFMSSPLFKINEYEIIKQKNFPSAGMAFNDAIERSSNDIIVFSHQDIIFPAFWENEFRKSINYLQNKDPNWGVIGCYGEAREDGLMKGYGYLYCTGNKKLLGSLLSYPMPVETLDEVVLIIRKSSGLRFDDSLPNFHLYGADICMTSRKNSRNCYAISAFCLHNTNKLNYLPKEFLDCYLYIKNKWINNLPIYHTCVIINKSDYIKYVKMKYYNKYVYKIGCFIKIKVRSDGIRSNNPLGLLTDLEKKYSLNSEKYFTHIDK